MSDAWHLNDYQRAIEALIADAMAVHGEDVVTDDLIDEVIDGTFPKMTDTLYAELSRRSSAMLREHRKIRKGFVRRNFRRWRAGFDLLEQLIVISQETGQAINEALRPAAIEANDALFEAVITNHARAVQVSREIMTLMIGGFPDGALARWRTLHEIGVTSVFLSQQGPTVAKRYILHDHITSYKRALNYMEHHERAES
ncbi:DUF5677 domain-containing protein [Sphingomonas sp. J315]|uniref:DUF5677 domain-containing protein n=1 Tax=Sphingomonas sp. J315 TaxID=2898433 RepID=UPI0021AE1DE5|nr:DUF5677 domain-containing protein [Sphingomonas sp. J315]UUY00094.1 DUF5677 domain-containing protein [Sphingomonas sp. J315]